MAHIRDSSLWFKSDNKPIRMIEYITSHGWKHAGNCGSCNGGLWYTHDEHSNKPQGRFRLKLIGNQRGMIEQNQNPQNINDFKIVEMFDTTNFKEKLTKYFGDGSN